MSGRAGRFPRVALVMASIAALGIARRGDAATGQRVTLAASFGSSYDSNILEYSRDQIALFEGGTRPDRFSLESTDDLVWNPALTLGWESTGPGVRRHAARLRAEGEFHQKNGTADFRSVSAGWRESWSRERRLSASWYTLPAFYLRQLFDEDYVPPFPGLSRYRRATFRLDIGALEWSQRMGHAGTFGVGGQYEHRRYDPAFRERDSNTGQGELAWGWTRLPRHGSVGLRGLYRWSVARARDGDEVPGVPPDDADVGYHGPGGGTHGELEIARRGVWRFTGDADYQLSSRMYDSDRPTDRYHFGRRDLIQTLELGLGVRWSHAWRARAFWQLDHAAARLGAAAPSSTDTGDYSRSQLGFRVDASRALWRSRSPEAGTDE